MRLSGLDIGRKSVCVCVSVCARVLCAHVCLCFMHVHMFPEAQGLLRQSVSRVWSCPLVALSTMEVTDVASHHMVEKFMQGPMKSWGTGCVVSASTRRGERVVGT